MKGIDNPLALKIGNARLDSDVARANLLVNGGFEIWQRGSGPFTAVNAYGPDRWMLVPAGTSTMSVTKDAANVSRGSTASAAIVYTHSVQGMLIQFMENAQSLAGETVTFSFRCKTDVAGAVMAIFNIDGTYPMGTSHTGSGQWETLHCTTTFPSSVTSVYVSIFFGASCTAYVDNAMLCVSPTPVAYVPLTLAEEWARCLRYYQNLKIGDVGAYSLAGYPCRFYVGHSAQMAINPTRTLTNLAYNNGSNAGADGTNPNSTRVYYTVVSQGDSFMSGNLTLEANP